jgi:hypothetical protein
VTLEVEAQADMAWVVVDDALPAGGTALGRGLGGESTIVTAGRAAHRHRVPAFEERVSGRLPRVLPLRAEGPFRRRVHAAPRQSGNVRIAGDAVEAMYAPEMFGEFPPRPGRCNRDRARDRSFLLAGAAAAATPTFDEVRSAHRASDAVLLDRHGVAIGTARVDASVRKLDWVALDAVSPALLAAVVVGEDKRFWEHDGVDWTGLAVAAWDSAWRLADGRRPRGGSTLTMQLAGPPGSRLARARRRDAHASARSGTRRAPRSTSSARGTSATSSRPTST